MVVHPVSRGGVVEVVAPAGVTREGRPVTAQAPVLAHEAASVHPIVVAPVPVRNAGNPPREPAPFPRTGPATVGAPPVATPVPAPAPAPGNGTVTVRQPSPNPGGQPPMQPMLRPEAMGGTTGNEGPVMRPVPRAEPTPRPAPVQPAPAATRPSAQSSAAETHPAGPPVARRAEPAPGHPRAPKKVDPQEKKGHPDPREP